MAIGEGSPLRTWQANAGNHGVAQWRSSGLNFFLQQTLSRTPDFDGHDMSSLVRSIRTTFRRNSNIAVVS
jgi:hypothetical protein